MIAHIAGTVTSVSLTHAVLDVHGVGYLIAAPQSTLATLIEGKSASLKTYLVVREDALDLYGFSEERERDFFILLQTVSGVGPKSALGVMDKGHYVRTRTALAQGDSTYLVKVLGIGNKTAQKLIVELRDKLGAETLDTTAPTDADALEALTVLGYSLDESRAALNALTEDITGTEARIKAALKNLNRRI
jgi:holliday junction DNA helicase RuvA